MNEIINIDELSLIGTEDLQEAMNNVQTECTGDCKNCEKCKNAIIIDEAIADVDNLTEMNIDIISDSISNEIVESVEENKNDISAS